MTNDHTGIGEDDLHAYADGFLDPERRAAVEAFLAENPEAAAMVADWQRQSDGFRAMFSGYERQRPGDEALVVAHPPRPVRRLSVKRIGWQAAAAVLLFVAGAGVGQFAPRLVPSTQLPQLSAASLPAQARSAFLIYASEVRHPVEVDASDQKHLATWLGKRLGHPLDIPDLSAFGFRLIGGRLVPVSGTAGALFMYEDDAGRRVTVLLGRNEENRETSFRFDSEGNVETFYWIDGPLGYAVTGEISRTLLQQIADACYKQFPT